MRREPEDADDPSAAPAPRFDLPLAPGSVIDGRYLVERVIGHGSMGVVYSARHLELGQRVAIKCLVQELSYSADVVARFAQEARTLAALESDHVARVLDIGRLESGTPYTVMEHLRGEDLGTLLEQCGPLPVEIACAAMLQTCEALAEAHELGIVHRDIKPHNLFLARRSCDKLCVKVLDFGISKLMHRDSGHAALTQSRMLIGSPLYMSPEQLRDPRRVDARSDVYSVGATLYELLTGSAPFDVGSVPEVCARILHEEAPPLRSRAPELSAELEAIVMRALRRNPAHRYGSAREFARALLPFAGSEHTLTVAALDRALAGHVGTSRRLRARSRRSASQSPAFQLQRPKRRRRSHPVRSSSRVLARGSFAAAVVVVSAWGLWHSTERTSKQAPVAAPAAAVELAPEPGRIELPVARAAAAAPDELPAVESTPVAAPVEAAPARASAGPGRSKLPRKSGAVERKRPQPPPAPSALEPSPPINPKALEEERAAREVWLEAEPAAAPEVILEEEPAPAKEVAQPSEPPAGEPPANEAPEDEGAAAPAPELDEEPK